MFKTTLKQIDNLTKILPSEQRFMKMIAHAYRADVGPVIPGGNEERHRRASNAYAVFGEYARNPALDADFLRFLARSIREVPERK